MIKLLIYQLGASLLSFITQFFIVKYYSVENYGEINMYISYYQVILVLSAIGSNFIFSKEIPNLQPKLKQSFFWNYVYIYSKSNICYIYNIHIELLYKIREYKFFIFI